MFDPWMRLMLALRPLVKAHCTEEEILFLRSELERYKTLVKMLRFENAEYQAKVANLLQLIQQISTSGSGSSTVNHLVHQISEALTKNQEFWQEMATSNRALQSSAIQKPPYLDSDGSPLVLRAGHSPISQLRQDADFYRQQVDMLKEEADEQQQRSTEHFQAQVQTLGERVEYLQNLLSLESSKVVRLSTELEEMNCTINEAKNYERHLEHTVSQLSKQLDQRGKQPGTPAASEVGDGGIEHGFPGAEAMRNQLNSYRELLEKLRNYFSADPKNVSLLVGTPFQPGGECDLFTDPTVYHSPLVATQHSFFGSAMSSPDTQRAHLGDMTPRSEASHQVAVLKRQLTKVEKDLKDTGAQIQSEIEGRENIENENTELHNRIITLERQLRRTQDEYDDDMVCRDLAHQRKVSELNDMIEEHARKITQLESVNRDMEHQLAEFRNLAEPEDDQENAEWESMRSKLRADVMSYKRALDMLQEEYDQFRQRNDPDKNQEILTAKDEQINLLEKEKQQWRADLEIQQVRLQSTTSLLEEAENRLKIASRERATQLNRISSLETQRDEAIRKAAIIEGRASAEKEATAARLADLESVRLERDSIRKELSDVKQSLAGLTAENAAEKRQLQARLREAEVHSEVRITDFKGELERAREDIERLQVEIQTMQNSEMEHKSTNQQQRWKINELEDELGLANRRITTLERQNADLDAELVRAKADLTSSREVANLRRAISSRMDDEWLTAGAQGSDTDDDEINLPSLAIANSESSSMLRGPSSRRSQITLRDRSASQTSNSKRDSTGLPQSRGNSRSRLDRSHNSSTASSPARHVPPTNQNT